MEWGVLPSEKGLHPIAVTRKNYAPVGEAFIKASDVDIANCITANYRFGKADATFVLSIED